MSDELLYGNICQFCQLRVSVVTFHGDGICNVKRKSAESAEAGPTPAPSDLVKP